MFLKKEVRKDEQDGNGMEMEEERKDKRGDG